MAESEKNGIMGEKNSDKGTSKSKLTQVSWWQPSLILFVRLSGWIAGPVIVALFVGRWLDRKYQTEPWLFIITVGFAFVLSLIGIVRESNSAMNDISQNPDKKAKAKQRQRD